MPVTPWFLWPAVWGLLISGAWLGIYELVAVFTRSVPTISSLVIPNVNAHPVIAGILFLALVALVAFLGYDWFHEVFMR